MADYEIDDKVCNCKNEWKSWRADQAARTLLDQRTAHKQQQQKPQNSHDNNTLESLFGD